MKAIRYYLSFLFCLMWLSSSKAKDIVTETRQLGLPVVVVDTENGETLTCTIATDPVTKLTTSIDANKVPSRLYILSAEGDTLYDSMPFVEDSLGVKSYFEDSLVVKISIRGNSSASKPKKSFKVKLQEKEDLLCRGKKGTYKDKNWALLRNQCDYTAPDRPIHTMIGLKINELMGLQWTPGAMTVNLIMNGDYRGIYTIIETVKRNTKCRLNVAEDGYIFELDPYWWIEPDTAVFQTQLFTEEFDNRLKYTFKYPDEDLRQEQVDSLQQWIVNFEDNISNGNYVNYIDVDSWARWLLAHDILGSNDAGGSNLFFTKYDSSDTTLVKMGNLWDFDAIEVAKDRWAPVHERFYFDSFFKQDSSGVFIRTYKNLYKEKSDSVFSSILAYIDSLEISPFFDAFDASMQEDIARWGAQVSNTMAQTINASRDWFVTRKAWLDAKISSLTSPAVYTINISDAEWCTMCVPFEFEIPEQLELYSVDFVDEDGMLALTPVTTTVSNRPYLVHGPVGNYRINGLFRDIQQPEDLVNGTMIGVLEDCYVPEDSYVLQYQNGELGFYRVASDSSMVISANHAYLSLADPFKPGRIRLPENILSIGVYESANLSLRPCFNVFGQKAIANQTGFYIKRMNNGSYKKIFKNK